MKRKESIPALIDIIFEHRNKSYGAYELRSNYKNRLLKSFLITVSVLITLVIFSVFKREHVTTEIFATTKDPVEIFDPLDLDIHQFEKPHQQLNVPADQPDEHVFIPVTDSMHTPDVDTAATANTTLGPNAGNIGNGTDTITSSDTTTNFSFAINNKVNTLASVDKIPEFPGGIEKFYSFLMKRIRYTREALNAEINGRVYVRFVVDEEGLLKNITLVRGLGYGLDEQVTEVLGSSPKWNPGMVRNTAVKTEMVLPVSFNLLK